MMAQGNAKLNTRFRWGRDLLYGITAGLLVLAMVLYSTQLLGKTEKAADADHADSADHAITAKNAMSADHATTADNATSADSATTAQNAANANQLEGKSATDFYAADSKVADSSHADEADVAATANQADQALEADHAKHAESAKKADSATNADKAKSADDATLAQNANKLDGKDSTAFAAAYKSTVVVSPVGTVTQNGQALLAALNGIKDASATKKYLVYIEPGTYDLGTRSLVMTQYVDIQGAGELNTLITSSVSGCSTGTVMGANSAELRFLTVRNTGTGRCNAAIYNGLGSVRLTHVTAKATGAGGDTNYGVFNTNATPTMTNVTATASGATSNYGAYNHNSNPTISQSKLSGSTNSLFHAGSGTAKVAFTQLVGPVRKDGGTLQCFNDYDRNMAAVTCP